MKHIPNNASRASAAATRYIRWAITPTVAVSTAPDPRAAFLLRAAARWQLVEIGEIDLDGAFDGLVEQFEALVPCQCDREVIERWERACPSQTRGRR
jgi:hypothetical protein